MAVPQAHANKKKCIGKIISVSTTVTVGKKFSALDYFGVLSERGRHENSLLFESAATIPIYGEYSIGIIAPCLKITGKGREVQIVGLTQQGKRFLRALGQHAYLLKGFEKKASTEDCLKLHLLEQKKCVTEDERLKTITPFDFFRAVLFYLDTYSVKFAKFCGLYGAISYDFIDRFEHLPPPKKETIDDPDYCLYFSDSMFIFEHTNKQLHLVAHGLIFTKDSESAILEECKQKIALYEDGYRKLSAQEISPAFEPAEKISSAKQLTVTNDTSHDEFIARVYNIQERIKQGDIFQAVLSRTIAAHHPQLESNALKIYRELRAQNPSPYMFFINFGNTDGFFLGASPEMSLRVTVNPQNPLEKKVQMRPIAGTKPRGIINGCIEPELDSRYELELKTDTKELAEHSMLLDLARNDIARITVFGTRQVHELFAVEKYAHVQHLVSDVRGILRPDLDALHAYLATMNQGTLTGAPKIMAMNIIRNVEETARGFYGGSVGYVTVTGEMDTAIAIRAIRIKGNIAYVRTGAGIVHDSVPESEFEETKQKSQGCLNAISAVIGRSSKKASEKNDRKTQQLQQKLRIIMLDNFDSFTYNLVDEFSMRNCFVTTVRNTITLKEFQRLSLQLRPHLILISPGPCAPKDAGNCIDIIRQYYQIIPIFGICLGHQCIVEAFGGSVKRAPQTVHGKSSLIFYQHSPVFHGLPNPFRAGRYHSLAAATIPDALEIIAATNEKPAIAMAVKHRKFPVVGLQFHPESILTRCGTKIIDNMVSLCASFKN